MAGLDELAGGTWLTEKGYYYLCCWNTFCTIASINIFFRCTDWEVAKSFVRAIYLSGPGDYLEMFTDFAAFPDPLYYGMWWTLAVFFAHELERYFKLKDRL